MMRKYLLILSLLITAAGMAQAPNIIYGKEIILQTRDTSSAELTIKNSTRNVLGYFKNIGGGKGQYTLIPQTDIIALPDSLLARYTKTQSDARYKSISYVPDWLDITGKPSNFSTTYALSNDIQDSLLNKVTRNGSYANPSWITSLDYSKLTGTIPTWNQNTTGNAATVTNGVYTTGSYSNPSWITSLDYSKLTGTIPTWNQNTTGTAASLSAVLSSSLGGAGSVTGILKANGSGLVSAASAGDIPNLSGSYVDLTTAQTLAGSKTFTSPLNVTNQNINISNAYFYSGKLTSGTNIALIGMNATNVVSIDPNGYGVVVGNAMNIGGLLSGTSASFSNAGGAVSISNSSDVWYNLTRGSSFNNIGIDAAGTFYNTNTNHRFLTASGGIEAGRISSGGRWLFGTPTDNGVDIGQFNGSIIATTSNLSQGLNVTGNGGFFNAANKFGIDNFNGASRFYSNGANTTTRGTFEFHINSSNGSLDDIALGISNTGAANFLSSVTATSLIKSGGTSSQFLMADGSVRTNVNSAIDTGRAAAQIVTGGSLNKVRDSIVNLIPTSTPTAGYYTPTISSTVNVTASTMNECRWTRIGDIVTVSGSVLILPTTISSSVSFQITLPIDTEHPSIYELSGVGSATELSINKLVNITGLTSSNTAAFNYVASQNSASDVVSFMFTYKVIPL